jgi:hypothetical protein
VLTPVQKNDAGLVKAGALSAAEPDSNPYADWSARLFTADRSQYILLSHTRSLYSVVMFGRGITSDDIFINRAMENLREFMTEDGLGLIFANFVAPAGASIRFCKPLSRSVTGSMNELETMAKHVLETGEWSPFGVGFKLNETLLSAIGTRETGGYDKPRDALKRLET